ncbi:MAG: hypothetical protein ACOC56_05175 [Atribacterota bacterium]
MSRTKRSRNMCWNQDCKEMRMIPHKMFVWQCPKCGNWNPNMHNFIAKKKED